MYLDDAQTAGTRNTRRKRLVTLFSFGVKNKWTVKSPAKEIGRLKEKLDVQTLTPEQMTRLLTSCDVLLEPAAGAMRAYIALAGFAGILPEKLHRLDMVRSAAGYSVRGQGGEERQSDVLRHSFASCWLAIHKNRAELAEHMGHSAKIIGKHFRCVMAQSEAQAWFAILPADTEAKILRMG